jgi:hypothetical protein
MTSCWSQLAVQKTLSVPSATYDCARCHWSLCKVPLLSVQSAIFGYALYTFRRWKVPFFRAKDCQIFSNFTLKLGQIFYSICLSVCLSFCHLLFLKLSCCSSTWCGFENPSVGSCTTDTLPSEDLNAFWGCWLICQSHSVLSGVWSSVSGPPVSVNFVHVFGRVAFILILQLVFVDLCCVPSFAVRI